jgi:HTH-type transcriptional regulator/antitoxin HigA
MTLIREFPLVPLRAKSDLEQAVSVMKRLAYRRSSLSSGEADYLTVLGDLIAQYEKRLPRLAEEMTPQEALTFLMEANGLAQADLVEYVGHKSNLSAFLSGNRGLSKRAASRLAEYFKVSPALFLPKA